MKIFLANPRGFCAGVRRALSIVHTALEIWGKPIYINHEIVHNDYVINKLKSKGIIFTKNINCIPKGSKLILSAHGASKKIEKKAQNRNLFLIDATCPLVKKVHNKVIHAYKNKFSVILIGNSEHPEVQGTLGQYETNFESNNSIYLVESKKDAKKLVIKQSNKLIIVTQTTLSPEKTYPIVKILCKKYPKIINPYKHDICYATINRQTAIKNLSKKVDIIFVIGSNISSNSNQLVKLIENQKNVFLINSENDINKHLILNTKNIGITAGASTPDILITRVIQKLQNINEYVVEEVDGVQEKITFNIPKSLQKEKIHIQ